MIKKLTKEMRGIIEEIATSDRNITEVLTELKIIEDKYQKKTLTYKEYENIVNNILSKKSKDEVLKSYNNYKNVLKKRLLEINSKIFKEISSLKHDIKLTKRIESNELNLPSLGDLEISDIDIKSSAEERLTEKKISKIEKQIVLDIPKPKEMPQAPKPIKFGFIERLVFAVKSKDKPWETGSDVVFGGILSKEFFEYLFKGKEKNKQYIGTTKVLKSILSYENKGIDLELGKEDVLDPYLLEKEIKELKNLISKKKPEIYKASTIGYLANITVRKMSIYFIEKYPDFFKTIYKNIRYANLKVLASTYINIVFFLSLLALFVTFPISVIFFAIQGGSFILVMLKTLLTSFGISAAVFAISLYYPNMQGKTRRRSINTNLPFAIDHMSSVIAAGVSPATMFKLISSSREYGEISIEIEKVTNYIDFFGYDILTALKAVALITPSEMFKEFIDGFVSTIETGGDLKNYLSQKSSEALLNYRLERQKYVESLSTYSDIYTGVLIAAPLFFVTALSLVSVIGGKIGGMDVNTIMVIGTYVVIPALNLLFLVFLEFNQPEV